MEDTGAEGEKESMQKTLSSQQLQEMFKHGASEEQPESKNPQAETTPTKECTTEEGSIEKQTSPEKESVTFVDDDDDEREEEQPPSDDKEQQLVKQEEDPKE